MKGLVRIGVTWWHATLRDTISVFVYINRPLGMQNAGSWHFPQLIFPWQMSSFGPQTVGQLLGQSSLGSEIGRDSKNYVVTQKMSRANIYRFSKLKSLFRDCFLVS
jgi:hypothetical protein